MRYGRAHHVVYTERLEDMIVRGYVVLSTVLSVLSNLGGLFGLESTRLCLGERISWVSGCTRLAGRHSERRLFPFT